MGIQRRSGAGYFSHADAADGGDQTTCGDTLAIVGDNGPVNVCKGFGGVFLMPKFSRGNRSSTSNRYANVFLHPGLHYGFGGTRAQVPGDGHRRLQAGAA
jgi:hypothetical protein